MDNICNVCDGKGHIISLVNGKYKKIPCTNIECIKGKVVDVSSGIKQGSNNNNNKISDEWINEYIPNRYFYDNDFNKRKLLKECPMPKSIRDIKFDNYVSFLDDYITRVNMGIIDKKSYYIYAPDRFGKKHFIYTVMKKLKQAGKNPSKLFNIHEVYVYLDKYKYDELYNKIVKRDLIFLDVGANPPKDKTRIVINYLKENSERLGIPLIIISNVEDTHINVYSGYNTSNPCTDRTKEGELGRIERKGISKESRIEYNSTMNDLPKGKGKYYSSKEDNNSKNGNNQEDRNTIKLDDLDDIQSKRRR